MAANQWSNPTVVNNNYSYLGTATSPQMSSRVNNSSVVSLTTNNTKSVDNSYKIVDKNIDTNLKSEAFEANNSSVSPKLSTVAGNSDVSKDHNILNSNDMRVDSVPQSMTSQNSANNGIRFQLSKQSTNVNKSLNNSFSPKIQSKAKEPNSYSKVENRQNASQSSSCGETTPDQWPESLREYVNRAFSQCLNELDKDRIEIILKGKLTKAHHEGVLFTKDWLAEPLPQLSSPKSLTNYSKQNSNSLTNKERNLKNKESERKRRPRSRSTSKSPQLYDSESNSSSDRFRDRKKKQKKSFERYVQIFIITHYYQIRARLFY